MQKWNLERVLTLLAIGGVAALTIAGARALTGVVTQAA